MGRTKSPRRIGRSVAQRACWEKARLAGVEGRKIARLAKDAPLKTESQSSGTDNSADLSNTSMRRKTPSQGSNSPAQKACLEAARKLQDVSRAEGIWAKMDEDMATGKREEEVPGSASIDCI